MARPSPSCAHDDDRLRLSPASPPSSNSAEKKESTAPRLSQLCPPCATPSSNSSLDYRHSDARIVENGFPASSRASKSAKVVLVRSDPEDYRRRQRHIHDLAVDVFTTHGGYVDLIVGDGGCVYFGAPLPSENCAEEAVSAALELLVRCSHLPNKVGLLQIRVSIATGSVVIADKPSNDWALNKEI